MNVFWLCVSVLSLLHDCHPSSAAQEENTDAEAEVVKKKGGED